MSRTLLGGVPGEVVKPVTETLFLVAMGFDTPVYFSTKEQVTWDSKTWLAADMKVALSGAEPTIQVYNEAFSFGLTVLQDGTAGRSIQIYQRYGSETPIMMFDGEMGQARIGDFVSIACRRAPVRRVPNIRIGPPVFNYIPERGLKIVTTQGTVELESR